MSMRGSFAFLLTVAVLFSTVSALYTSSDKVVDLDPQSWSKLVEKSDDVWLIEFYAPWCGHCKSLAPEYKKVALALNGVVKVGAVDMDKHPSVGQPFNVQGFPTIKFFGLNKKQPVDHQGARTAAALVDFAFREARKVVDSRLSGKSSSSSSSSSSSGNKGGKIKVVELTESNFEELVLQSQDLWMVEFFAPWCGHCKSLAPQWERAASELDGVAKLGAVDATVYQQLASKYGIRGYPTIKVFRSGEKKGSPMDYEGQRTADAIVQYAKNMAEAAAEPKPVVQLLGSATVEEQCSKGTCIISFLPHILDSGAKGRDRYIDTLQQVSIKNKRQPFTYVWSEAGAQPELEAALGVGGSGYPAVVALNLKKERYANLAGAFSVDSMSSFIRDLSRGRQKLAVISKLPEVQGVTAWDGKDAPKPQESEEYKFDDEIVPKQQAEDDEDDEDLFKDL